MWTANTVKRPPQQPAQPPVRQLLGAADAHTAHPATFSTAPAHQRRGTPPWKRHQREHRPQRPTERSDPTQHAKGRTGDCPGPRKGATTRRNVTRGGNLVGGHGHGGGHGGGPGPTPRPAGGGSGLSRTHAHEQTRPAKCLSCAVSRLCARSRRRTCDRASVPRWRCVRQEEPAGVCILKEEARLAPRLSGRGSSCAPMSLSGIVSGGYPPTAGGPSSLHLPSRSVAFRRGLSSALRAGPSPRVPDRHVVFFLCRARGGGLGGALRVKEFVFK